MWCLRTLGVLSVTLSLVWSMTLETTSARSIPKSLNNTLEHASNQVIDTNASMISIMDVRTPPKVQSQIKDKLASKYSMESSHAGVAIPIDEDIEMLEESTKKMNFYKLERPTTSNGGLSTWILLSGQTSPTSPKPVTKKPASLKPVLNKDEKSNETLMLSEKPMKIVKPVFKPRSTTQKPMTASISSTKTTTVKVNTFSPSPKSTTRKPTKLTKVKASLLQNLANANVSTTPTSKTKSTTSIKLTSSTTPNTSKESGISTSSMLPSQTTELNTITTTSGSSAALPVEAKNGEQELPPAEEKKKKTQKRKKNKRRKPSKASKEGNNKLKEVESPGTQLYSYLRSEIIPVTVGVSLVGLLVTAGLASYYLQPFAALRRSDPIDRKDTEGSYYYQNDYSNAMPEEEAIGKVIAGMPENTLQENTYKQPTSRNTYPQNVRYRHVDRRSQIYMNPYGSVEDVKLNDRTSVNYNQGSNYSTDKKFVVGNVPKEAVSAVTPAVVPEHGPRYLKEEEQKFVVGNIPNEFYSPGASPRNLRIRKRRQIVPDDLENEISPEENEIDGGDLFKETTQSITTAKIDITTVAQEANDTEIATTEEATKDSTPHNVFNPNERPNTLFELLTDIFRLKVKLGLELLQNVTKSVSTYVSKVHTKLDEHYRKVTRGNTSKHTN